MKPEAPVTKQFMTRRVKFEPVYEELAYKELKNFPAPPKEERVAEANCRKQQLSPWGKTKSAGLGAPFSFTLSSAVANSSACVTVNVPLLSTNV